MNKVSIKWWLSTIFAIALSISEVFGQEDTRNLSDSAMVTPTLNIDPLPEYDYPNMDYSMTIGIERTTKGRIWACWVGGGDNADAYFVLASSDNDGKKWSKPRLVIDQHRPWLTQKRSVIVGNLWTDPKGRLWLFFDQSMEQFDGRAGVWYTICENPDSKEPKWSTPVRIWHGMSLNKPIVLSDGTWMINISLWPRWSIKNPYKNEFHELDSLRKALVFTSSDEGKTWQKRGGVLFPKSVYDEHMVVEKKDGSLWMTARTDFGIWESSSSDKGYNWSEPKKYLEHTVSRFFIRRLKSGNLLMVKHGEVNERTAKRSHLTAFLSDDEGKSWKGGLLLDERNGVSYPDGFQAPNGRIYISYDRNRSNGEILMARFKEKDVLAKEFKTRKAQAKILVARPMKNRMNESKK